MFPSLEKSPPSHLCRGAFKTLSLFQRLVTQSSHCPFRTSRPLQAVWTGLCFPEGASYPPTPTPSGQYHSPAVNIRAGLMGWILASRAILLYLFLLLCSTPGITALVSRALSAPTVSLWSRVKKMYLAVSFFFSPVCWKYCYLLGGGDSS